MEVQVAEIKLRALRRMGELSKALEKAQGERTDIELHPSGGKKSKTDQLSEAGVSTSSAGRAEQLADVPANAWLRELAEKERQ